MTSSWIGLDTAEWAVVAAGAAAIIGLVSLATIWGSGLVAWWGRRRREKELQDPVRLTYLIPKKGKLLPKYEPLFRYCEMRDDEQFPEALEVPTGEWIIMTRWHPTTEYRVRSIAWGIVGPGELWNEPENPFVVERRAEGTFKDWHGYWQRQERSFPRNVSTDDFIVDGIRIRAETPGRFKLNLTVSVEGHGDARKQLDLIVKQDGSRTDLLPYALPLAAGLLALLLAPAVDRWAERFDAWVEGKHRRQRPKPRNP